MRLCTIVVVVAAVPISASDECQCVLDAGNATTAISQGIPSAANCTNFYEWYGRCGSLDCIKPLYNDTTMMALKLTADFLCDTDNDTDVWDMLISASCPCMSDMGVFTSIFGGNSSTANCKNFDDWYGRCGSVDCMKPFINETDMTQMKMSADFLCKMSELKCDMECNSTAKEESCSEDLNASKTIDGSCCDEISKKVTCFGGKTCMAVYIGFAKQMAPDEDTSIVDKWIAACPNELPSQNQIEAAQKGDWDGTAEASTSNMVQPPLGISNLVLTLLIAKL